MARQISYTDVVKQIQSNIGYIPSNRNKTDIKKALERGESKASVIARFSDKYEITIMKDLTTMLNSNNKTEQIFAKHLLSDDTFMKNVNMMINNKIDKNKHPSFYRRYRSAQSYATHTNWKKSLLETAEDQILPRISDKKIKQEIIDAINNMSIYEYLNPEITEAFAKMKMMYRQVKTKRTDFIKFLQAIDVLDVNAPISEQMRYLKDFDINIISEDDL